jgi:hypothetical protein
LKYNYLHGLILRSSDVPLETKLQQGCNKATRKPQQGYKTILARQ